MQQYYGAQQHRWAADRSSGRPAAPVLIQKLSSEQYDRFEQTPMKVSVPVAQIVAGFSKIFVGEIIEKARAVQARRGETGPLAPDHLREAYRMYQEETGRVGVARPLKANKLFVK
ncbi:TAFII28-domain-containing protein [Mycena venus]|uniref:TAFII28-domain-containing protein n=1 Tax=Mycena venus TaxID=2733690 RepID=A0A8H6YBR8_9AGAR|nr:TAFII28-domain-containing protein [Mycena venus]